MALRLYNSLTRSKEPLHPLTPGIVRMYVCGPTVYNYCHVGHARAYVCFDMVVRYLRQCGLQVHYVSNITDIDDRILTAAAQSGESARAIAERFTQAYFEDMQRLSVLRADHHPRVTDTIPQILDLISTLVDHGHAYFVDGDVFFDVTTAPQLGELSHQDPEQQLAGARVEVDVRKRDPRDFALWKSAKPGEESWPSPWGAGRPGWHIECSAMSIAAHGPQLDIHGGGIDLIFPHHECEVLQSESATGKRPFSRIWMHNGHVMIDQVKMSKSLGNFFTIREVLAHHPPSVLRFLLLNTQYRKPVEFTPEAMVEASKALLRLQQGTFQLASSASAGVTEASSQWAPLAAAIASYTTAMDDDFNTRDAIATLFTLLSAYAQDAPKLSAADATTALAFLRRVEDVLSIGLFATPGSPQWASTSPLPAVPSAIEDAEVMRLLAQRDAARARRDFPAADTIRRQLSEAGIEVQDVGGTSTWRRR